MSAMPAVNDDAEQLKRALVTVKKLRAKVDALEQARTAPVAIVGIGCRLPGGVKSPVDYWQLLRNGRDAITEVPPERWDADEFYDPHEAPGTVRTKYGGFIQNVDQFDPHFFGISPREAAAMDPQQRIVLEVAWAALEDAGIVPASLAGSRTGVFIGIGLNDYGRLQVTAQDSDPRLIDNYFIAGNALCITPNRLSYTLDLRGPSLAIDTACSSSLTATHVACQSLRSGESTLALVGGVNLMLSPALTISVTKFLSPDGRCKTFDARADGYARGEGAIVIVLKLLSQALADHDMIYAVIRGSAANQDGFSSGLTVPNGVAQQAMLRAALANAGVQPEQIDYVEAHGTGTSLGDPIEANALGEVLGRSRADGHYLAIGSVKTNIGHLEAGAGIAGLVKVALALKYGEIPPSLHYVSPNPRIPFDDLHLRVQSHLGVWPRRDHPPLAGVSSFGFGGANVHVILQAPPERALSISAVERPVHVLTLSAKSDQALRDLAQRYADHFSAQPALSITDACFTANTARSVFAHRAAIAAETLPQLQAELNALAQGEPAAQTVCGQTQRTAKPKIAFLFTGQGAQYVNMGRQLYETQPVFKTALDRCDAILQPLLGESLLAVLYPQVDDEQQKSKINATAFTQPALFALEYALTELWKSWGVEPSAVLGHSVGEYVAACVAGVFSLEDGLKLIATRGRLMQQLPAGGAMVAVFAEETIVRAACAPYASSVSCAAINGPKNIVISGREIDVQAIGEQLQAQGIKTRRLVVSHAFHSPLLEPMLDDFEQAARAIQFSTPRVPLVSNVSGRIWPAGEVPDARYWRDHVRAAVQFAAGVAALQQAGCELYVEIGPHPTLIGMAQHCVPAGTGVWLPSLREGQAEWSTLLKSVGTLFVQGAAIDWAGFDRVYARRRVTLPTYPFQHERYWFAAPRPSAVKRLASGAHPLLGSRLRSPAIKGGVFESRLSVEDWPLLGEHRVYGSPVLPATAYVELVLAAAREMFAAGTPAVEDLIIQQALTVPDGASCSLQMILAPEHAGLADFQIFSAVNEADWQLHAAGRVRVTAALSALTETLDGVRSRCTVELDPARFYERIGERGLEYGPHFQIIRRLQIDPQRTEVVAHIQLDADLLGELAVYRFHPALLDACWQALGALFLIEADAIGDEIYIPISCDALHVWRAPAGEIWSHATLRSTTGSTREVVGADLHIYDAAGQLLAEARGLQVKRASRAALQAHPLNLDEWLYQIEWRSVALDATAAAFAGAWLLMADEDAVSVELARQLRDRGADCILARHDDERALAARTDWRGVVVMARPAVEDSTRSVLRVVQALALVKEPPQLWLITRGAQTVRSGDVPNLEHASLWGYAATIALEQPNLRCVSIDLDRAPSVAEDVLVLLAEFAAGAGEDRVAYRSRERFVARLAHPSPPQPASTSPVQLVIPMRGLLDHLTLQPVTRRAPGPGEIEIRVRATGLNFRDVLNALGMYPGEAGPLGSECSGVVVAVGEGVDATYLGAEVMALALGSFSTYAITRAELAVTKPQGLSFEAAATLPIAFLTAQYGLHELAHLKRGDRVLIHAAAGGVGLAAVQIAQRAGAEIFGTASPDKQAYLRALGVPHVLNSRTLDFADEIKGLTNGEGVDVILNSLSGDFIAQSVAVMKPRGRFLEIGKRDIWSREQMAQIRPEAAYHVYDLGDVMRADPAAIQAMLRDLALAIERGELKPLPQRIFRLDSAAEAFRFMERAKHIGKIVVAQQPDRPAHPIAIRADGTYLITGGLGGLGLHAARWLVDQGARHLILLGRHGPSHHAQAVIDELIAGGSQVVVAQADVSQPDQLRAILADIDPAAPLRGIIHTAGVNDDGVLTQQTWERFVTVAAPKSMGAWNLHTLTHERGDALDFFLLYSSISSVLGSVGQGNYAAANAYLDALAALRQAQGLPALSINWGPWSDVGMFAALSAHDRQRRLAQGMQTISAMPGAQLLSRLLPEDAAQRVALPIDWRKYDASSPLLAEIKRDLKPITTAPTAAPAADVLTRLQAAPPNQRRALLLGYVREQSIKVLGLSASHAIDPRQPLRELGLDSLMAVELRNALGAGLQRSLPATLLFDYPALDTLTDFLAQDLWPGEPPPAQSDDAEPPATATQAADLIDLSEEEAEALLLQELAAGKRGRRHD